MSIKSPSFFVLIYISLPSVKWKALHFSTNFTFHFLDYFRIVHIAENLIQKLYDTIHILLYQTS